MFLGWMQKVCKRMQFFLGKLVLQMNAKFLWGTQKFGKECKISWGMQHFCKQMQNVSVECKSFEKKAKFLRRTKSNFASELKVSWVNTFCKWMLSFFGEHRCFVNKLLFSPKNYIHLQNLCVHQRNFAFTCKTTFPKKLCIHLQIF